MKPIINLKWLLFLLLLIGHMVDANPIKITAHTKIGFGRNSKGCKGFGICTSTWITFNECTLSTGDDGKTFVLEVPAVNAGSYPEQFSQKSFIMEEDYTFPAEIQRSMNLTKPILIKAGSYQMEKSSAGFTIFFN